MIREGWRFELHGGAFDDSVGTMQKDPPARLIVWACAPDCDGHATANPSNPSIVLRTAEAYVRTDVDLDERLAVYEVGKVDPDAGREVEEDVPALADVGLGDGWPVAR